jgi:hypothetical protein
MFLSSQAIGRLIADHAEPCISLYFPAVRGDDTAQNAIRYKNLLKTAEEELAAFGLKPADVEALMRPARELLTDGLFWDRLENGVAAFLSPTSFEVFTLPLAVEESVHVNRHFRIKPLLRLVSMSGRFMVLAISRTKARLFEAAGTRLHELKNAGLPEGVAEMQSPERAGQQHTRSFSVERHGSPGVGTAHGREVDKVDREDLRRYFSAIDTVINHTLRDSATPLVIAGVDYEVALYRQSNTYPFLEETSIEGNFDRSRGEALLERARAIVAPRFERNLEAALERYHNLAGTNRITDDVRAVVPAAHDGRVHALLLAEGRSIWGVFEPDGRGFQVRDRRQPGDDDLLDTAAVRALQTGAQVFVLPPERMPSASPVAALLRY